jgi:hypothetical protein
MSEAAAQFYPTWILKYFRRLHAVLIYIYELGVTIARKMLPHPPRDQRQHAQFAE